MFTTLTTLFVSLLSPAAHAQDSDSAIRMNGRQIGQERRFGLGVSLGDPTALSGKLYLNRIHALDMALSTSPYGDWPDVYAHAVYLWHPSVLATEPGFDLGWHVGVGGVVWDGHGWWPGYESPYADAALGVRTPIGLDLDLKGAPVQFSADLAANTYLVPGTDVDLGFALAARYYF